MGDPTYLTLTDVQREPHKRPSQDLEDSPPTTKGKGVSGPGDCLPIKDEGTVLQSAKDLPYSGGSSTNP